MPARYQASRGLQQFRDRVLRSARLKNGDVFLDVGCGDGLLGFGALSLVGPDGRVIFSDQSTELIDVCRRVATESGVADRCNFIRCDACTLDSVADNSVDAIGTRSVLMYLPDRVRAFGAFHRVLKTGGGISLFEPINAFGFAGYPDLDRGTDFSSVSDLRERIVQYYNQIYSNDPTVNFDAADLFDAAEAAGFATIQVRAELSGASAPPRNFALTPCLTMSALQLGQARQRTDGVVKLRFGGSRHSGPLFSTVQ